VRITAPGLGDVFVTATSTPVTGGERMIQCPGHLFAIMRKEIQQL